MQPVIADVLAARGSSALVVRGEDGLDKLTTTGPSRVWVVRDGRAVPELLDPQALGLPLCSPGQLLGGTATTNAEVLRSLLDGQRGPVRDVVLLNAAAAVAVATLTAEPLINQLAPALAKCTEAIDTGLAATTLTKWIAA
jgi:anthranilate phosphoribosyltransferase